MRMRSAIPALVPAALLLAGAAAAFAARLPDTVAVGAASSAVAWCAAIAVIDVGHRRRVAALVAAAGSVAAGTASRLPAKERFGNLSALAKAIDDLSEALATANEAATTDRLTHVANRPTVLAFLFAEVERVSRYARPLSVAFIDIDHFKVINDTHGHEAGDIVLEHVARLFKENTRSSDLVARYGGEEFVLVFPETSVDEATAVAEKLRVLVMKYRFPGAAADVAASVSIGIAGGQGQHLRVDQLLRDADAAMYSAKSLGRNQTFVFAEIDDDSARIPRAPISPASRLRATEVGEYGRRAAEAALAAVVEPLPHYRGRPSSLIAAIAVKMATQLQQPDAEIQRVRIASQLHDIGKVAIPEQILEKPGDLTPEEWQTVVQHPRLGQVIIEEVATVRDAGAIILHHHERYSGHGYPFGLRGPEIPLGARIVAIADAYDAMVHDRPYRAAIGHEAAVEELRRHARLQFDPDLVTVFCDLFAASPPAPDPSLLIAQLAPATSGRRRHRRASA